MVGSRLIEPFAGSAAISFGLLQKELISSAVLIESDPLVTTFWKVALNDTRRMMDLIMTWPITIDSWTQARAYLSLAKVPESKDELLMAGFSYLLLNRTCYSGIVTAGPIGGRSQTSNYPIHCRFNRQHLSNLVEKLSVYRSYVSIIHGDGLNYLEDFGKDASATQSFIYADPPYYVQGPRLYRKHFRGQEHDRLAKALCNIKAPWLLSYDDHENIKSMYSAHTVKRIYFDYTIRVSRSSPEVVISNRVLPQSIS